MNSSAPWVGRPEPPYMPGLRRHFAESLTGRLALAREALDALTSPATRRGEPGRPRPARVLHLFGHSLAGTAPSVGGDRIGELGHRLGEFTRSWEKDPDAITEEGLVEVRRWVEQIASAAEVYRGWVEGEASGSD